MIGRVLHYHRLKRNQIPHRLAWSMAGLHTAGHKVIKVVSWIVFVCSILFLLSEQANSAQDAADNRVQSRLTSQQGEIEALRRIVATCLQRGDNALWLDNELHFCGLSATGITR